MIFFQIPQISIRSGAHKLFRRFFGFSQFLTAISRKLWCHLAIFPKLCMVIELVVPIKKGGFIFFDLIHSFSATGQNVDFLATE